MEHDIECCREKFHRAFEARCPRTPLRAHKIEKSADWEIWQLETATGRSAEKVGSFSGCCVYDAKFRALESMYL